jgi:hypothetical protein
MFRVPTDTRVRIMRTIGCLVALMAFAALALATATSAPAAAPWRAFSPTSIWNVPASPQSIAPTNPFAGQFGSGSMGLSGTPDNPKYSSPIYFATPGDPVAAVHIGQPDWLPGDDTAWNGQPVPVPAGVTPASGSDGHLTVVSADRRTAWDFWRCTAAGAGGYTADVIVQWNLAGPGYSADGEGNSARGSGTPLLSTTLRADEALNGVNHALGITVPSVSSDWVFPPATKSDGNDGPDAIKYGMLFVLRPDYQPPANASIGVRNVVQALKTYGAYVVDQGSSFEMDADFTQPAVWAQAGLSQDSFNITADDMRPAKAGNAPPPPPPAKAARAKRGRRVLLSVDRRRLLLGGQLRLSGRVRYGVPAGAKVRLMVKTPGAHRWRRLRQKRVNPDGSFATWPRYLRDVRAARFRGAPTYTLHHLHLSSHAYRFRVRAVVGRAGRSNIITVRLLHKHATRHHRRH